MSTSGSNSSTNPLPSTASHTFTSFPSLSPPTTSPTSSPSPEALRQTAEARRALEASLTSIGTSLSSSLQSRAQNLHANTKVLSKQEADVAKATEGLRRENEKLKKVVDEGSRKVKELGNVQNWAEMLEIDFLVLQETVRLANGGSASGSGSEWSGSESGSWSGSEDRGQNGMQGIAEGRKLESVALGKNLDTDGDTAMQDSAPVEDVKGKGKQVLPDTAITAVHPAPPLSQGTTNPKGDRPDEYTP